MPNYELANDQIATIPILVTDAAGSIVPPPAGDTFTAASSNAASLGVAIGATASGAPAVVVTPLVQVSPGITVTVTDADGLTAATQIVDVIAGTPSNLVIDVAQATLQTQPEPSNPGP